MIHLIYGKDKFRTSEFVSKITALDSGKMNTVTFDAGTGYEKVVTETMTTPFLSDKRVIIVRNLLKSKDKTLLDTISVSLANVPETTELVFFEDDDPDQRLSITKNLKKVAQTTVLNDLSSNETAKYIVDRVQAKGGVIDLRSANLLGSYVGADILRLNNEIDKLLAYDKNITADNVTDLVDAGYFNSIFDLTDAVGQKNLKSALGHLEKLLASGENEIYLVSMIAMQIRNLLVVSDLASHHLSQSEIASKAKLHPYVVQKALAQIKRFKLDELLAIHRELLAIDQAAKTGSGDPTAMLEQLIVVSANKK